MSVRVTSRARPRRVAAWITAAGALAVSACQAPPSARPATWVEPVERTIQDSVTATGVVRLKTGASVRVGAQISGIVRQLNVTVGSPVRQGDVIAEIDSRPVQARTAQARAQLARAEVSAAKARADLRRAVALFDAGGVSAQQLDDARGAGDLATASVAAARTDLAAASLDLDYVTLRAPISGVVASVSTQRGETVASAFAAPTFVTIIEPRALEVIAMVDEADIGGVRVGQAAVFTTETFPDREFRGEVARIAPDATLVSGVVNYEVAIRILGDVSALRPQMTVNTVVTTAERRVVLAPAAAVLSGAEGRYVLVRSAGGTPVRRAVGVGPRRGGETEITRGLGLHDRVLVGQGPVK